MKHRVFAFLLAVCLLLCAAPGAWAVSYTPEQQYEILLQLDALIREEGLESFDEDDPLGRALVRALEEDPALYEKLMAEMLSGYDPYTRYMPAGSYSAAFDPETSYVGVGVTIQAHPQGALVVDVNLTGPAAAAGIRMNDVLIEAGGVSLAGLAAGDVSDLLRGEAGTSVTVKVLREGRELSFTLTRAPLVQRNYSGGHIAQGTYYMKWSRIADDGSYWLFRMGLLEMEQLGDTCLILDLRDNPGGSLDLAFSITSDLIPEAGPFFQTAYRDPLGRERLTTRYIIAEGDGADIPHIFILTNENTASAAEIITAGLRDTGRATVIGQTTYGKARAQQHILLEDDSAVVLTTMQLLSLERGDYNEVGLAPDVEVSNTLYPGADALRVPDTTALAPGNCSDNGELLNRALAALGLLEALPEKPYQVGQETLAACRELEAAYLSEQPRDVGVSRETLRLVNHLLDLRGQGMYVRDDQLAKALELAADALNDQ